MVKRVGVIMLGCFALLGVAYSAYADSTIDSLLENRYLLKLTLVSVQNRVDALDEVQQATFRIYGYDNGVRTLTQNLTINLNPGERIADKLFKLDYEAGFLFYDKETNNLKGFEGVGVRSASKAYDTSGRLRERVVVADIPSDSAFGSLARSNFTYNNQGMIRAYTSIEGVTNYGGGAGTIVKLYAINYYYNSYKISEFVYGCERYNPGGSTEDKYHVFGITYSRNGDIVSCYIRKL